MPARYLRSKLLPPSLPTDSIVRHRLVDRLDLSTPVWLVSAPAGYGKTTLVVQALETLGDQVAWLTVDAGDNDAVRFWTHLAAALVDDPLRLDEIVERIHESRLDQTADALVREVERSSNPITLVLDDVQELTTTSTLDVLGRLVVRPPEGLRIVMASRSDPQLPIGRLRAPGLISELRAQDLAFTESEAAAVLPRLTESDLQAAVRRTEGWATALRLIAISINRAEPGTTLPTALDADGTAIADYLNSEALAALRPELQQFLIETSIVDELWPTLADRLTGRPGNLATLRELTAKQIFTELLDPATNTFRYHRLFRDFLRRRAEELDAPRLAALHGVAAQWHVEQQNPTSTIRHAIAAGDDDLALATIREYFPIYAMDGRIATAQQWLERYGIERCLADPELRLMSAWAALNIQRYDDVPALIAPFDHEQPAPGHRAQIHVLKSHLARHLGNLDEALEEATAATTLIPSEIEPGWDWSFVRAALCMAQVVTGRIDPDEAWRAATEGARAGNDSSTFIGYSTLAFLALLDGDLDQADAYADQVLSLVTSPRLERFHQPSLACMAKSDVAVSRGRLGDAQAAAAHALQVAEDGHEPLYVVMARCRLARTAHAAGHLDEARLHVREAAETLGEHTPGVLVDLVRETRNAIRFAGPSSDGPIELSEREQAVLKLLPHGLSRKELGSQLFISENTVKTYLTSLRHKLGVNGRSSQIVERAVELGLLPSTSAGSNGG